MKNSIFKKIIFTFLTVFISVVFFNVKASAIDIKATGISLIDKSSTAEVETPVMVNNEVSSKIILNKVDDYAVFDLTITNNEKNKYKIESIIDNNESEYITTSYDYSKDYFQGDTKVKVKFLYKNKLINQDKVKIDNLVVTIKLLNDKGESTNIIINNPKTGDNITLYIIIFILGILGLIYSKKKIDFKGMKVGVSILLFSVLLLPFVIFAIDRFEVSVTFKGIEATGEYEVYDVMVEGIGIRKVRYGKEVGELPEQPKAGYSFNGYEDKDEEKTVTEDTIVTRPMTIRPMYTIITYNITYDYNKGTISTPNPETYTVEDTITLNNPSRKGYTFAGWTGSNGESLQTEVTINGLTGDLNYKANYSANPDTAYKVIHRYPNLDGTYVEEVENLVGATDSSVRPQTRDKTGFTSPELQDLVINAEGTSEVIYNYIRNNYRLTLLQPEDIESAFTTGSYPYQTVITVKAKDKVGYTFSKWSDNETAKEYTFELVKDTELYAIYTPNPDTAYTVVHKTMNLDGTTYTVKETENLTGTTDSEVTPGVKTYEGFTSPNTQTVRIKPDGTTVVEYLYTRNKYTLTIEDKEKVEEDKTGKYFYGTEITVVAKDIPGYVFTGWENGGNTKTYTFILTGDKTIKPKYVPGDATAYTVVHKTMNLDGTTYTVKDTENLTGTTDTNVTPNTKTYVGFTSPTKQTVKIKGDGSTVVEYLYTRNKYSLIYVDEDEIDLPGSTPSGDYPYEKEITVTAKDKTGYTFVKWNTGETTKKITKILVDDLVLDPEYTPNKYNVIFNSNTGTGTMDNQQMTYDIESILSKNLFTKPGYLYKGWNTKADKTGTHYDDEALVKNLVPSGEITLYAEWVEAHAMFDTGSNVNAKMKKLAGNSSVAFYDNDLNITSIKKSTTKPDISNMTNDNIVSISNSTYNTPIYMWYDSGTIYWWSEDATPDLNVDSSSMFSNLKNVSNIELNSFNTSNVTNMSNMFGGCENLTSLDVSQFNTSNVTNMSNMFGNCSSLTSLDLSSFDTSKVKTMRYMFYNCKNLTSLDVSHFDTSNVEEMSQMFQDCNSLTSLDLSHFDTSNVTTMSSMFSGCSNLTSLDVSHFNTSKVIDMDAMFAKCSSLTSLDVSNFNTSKVRGINFMFDGCSSLTSLDVTHFDTSNVTDMTSLFQNCTNLTSLDVSHFDTSNVTTMSSMFSGCSSLTSLDLSSFDTSNVEQMHAMFWKCTDLTTLDVSNFNTSKVTDMYGMFRNCSSLTTIYASNRFVTTAVTSSYYMFLGDTKIEGGMGTTYSASHIDKEYAHIDGGLDNPGYFYNKGTVNITFNANGGEGTMNVQTIPYNASTALNENTFTREGYLFDGWNTKADGTGTSYDDKASIKLTKYTPLYAQWKAKVATLDTGANVNVKMKKLAGNPSATNRSFDNSITSIQRSTTKPDISAMTSDNIISTNDSDAPVYAWFDNGTIYYYSDQEIIYMNSKSSDLFSALSKIETIDLSGINTSKVTDMSFMFSDCVSLSSLDISHFDTSKVTNLSNMFYNCNNLTTIDVTHFDTINAENMNAMFCFCKSLTSLDVSHFNTSKVTNMSYMFNGCNSITSLDVSQFDTSNVTDMNCMFSGCNSLTSLDVSQFDTSKVTDMYGMFNGCNSITSLDVSQFDTSNVTNMNRMFESCNSLTSLDVSHFDTSKVTGMQGMFEKNISITSLDLSSFDTSKVTSMRRMFYGSNNLTTIYVSNSFVTNDVSDSPIMFSGMSSKLKGESGTTWSSSNPTDKTYARIDDPDNGNPGYFTYKAAPTGANISRFTGLFKASKSIENIIVLIGLTISLAITGVIVLITKNRKED